MADGDSKIQLDTVIKNARVLTMDARQPHAGAVGILNGRIAAVAEDGRDLSAARVLDARGMTVLPGFHDAHCHTTWFGLTLVEIDCSGFERLEELYDAISRAAQNLDDGEWIKAAGFDPMRFGGRTPNLSGLTVAAPRNPVIVRHASGHFCFVNTDTLRRAGLIGGTSTAVACEGLEREPSGTLTGQLSEAAQSLVQSLFLPESEADIVAAIDRATKQYAAEGITSFTEAGIGGGWIGHSPRELSAYQRAYDEGRLHARAQLMPTLDLLHEIGGNRNDGASIGLDLGIRTGLGNEWISIGPAKVFLDGSLLGLTAAMNEPFCSGPQHNHGAFTNTKEALLENISSAVAAGWSIAAHAIGDRATELAADIFHEIHQRYGLPRIPHRVEHGGVVTGRTLRRLHDAGVVVVPQPGFIPSFGAGMRAALGETRTAQSYRARSQLDIGMVLPGSSDRPVAPGPPLRSIRAFTDRVDDSGTVFGEPERITVLEALEAFTTGSARATGVAGSRGILAPGQLADIVCIEGDLLAASPEQIEHSVVAATMAGGEFTWNEL